MQRLAFAAVIASGALGAAGAAQAQQICCVAPPMRGPMPAPAYQPPPPQYPAPAPYGYEEPPPVAGGLKGYVGVEYAETHFDPETPSPRYEFWTGEGAVATTWYGFGVQGDIKVARYSGPDGEDWVTSPTAHVFKRNPYGLIGAFLGWSDTDGADLIGGGIEGQANMARATLYGSLGYGHVNDAEDYNIWSARVEGRYFLTDNLRGDASVAYSRQNANDIRSKAWTYGIGAEYQLDSLPLAIHAGYQHVNGVNSALEANTVRVGLRWSLTGDTLAERDRVGPSLANVTDLFSAN